MRAFEEENRPTGADGQVQRVLRCTISLRRVEPRHHGQGRDHARFQAAS